MTFQFSSVKGVSARVLQGKGTFKKQNHISITLFGSVLIYHNCVKFTASFIFHSAALCIALRDLNTQQMHNLNTNVLKAMFVLKEFRVLHCQKKVFISYRLQA